ncbi:12327_t:CDS:1, partial [Gigaspora rosea]
SIGGIIPKNDISLANPLIKRHEDKVCYDYLVLTATFDDSKLTGVVTLAGDDSRPVTFVYGLFSHGIEDPDKFCIFLEDCNHNVVYNLTKELDLKFDGHGGTKPFCAYIDLDIFDYFYGNGDDYKHGDKHGDDKHGDKHGDKRKRQAGVPYVSTSSPADSAPATQAMP